MDSGESDREHLCYFKGVKFFVVFCYDIDTIVLPRTKTSLEL